MTESHIIPNRPDVAVQVSRELDSYHSWDGDGPDPRNDGYSPYTVTVKAMTIRNGVLLEGVAYLGACYFLPEEPIGDVHGYLPDMLAEALTELDNATRRIA